MINLPTYLPTYYPPSPPTSPTYQQLQYVPAIEEPPDTEVDDEGTDTALRDEPAEERVLDISSV